MDLSNIISGKPEEKMHWGSGAGLWDIARFKIMGLQITELFLAQVKDKDLKRLLHAGLELEMIPHIEKIQAFMLKEGVRQTPTVPSRLNLDIKKNEPNSIYTDQQIASFTREVFRHGLNLDMIGYTSSTRQDIRKLILNILLDDAKGFDNLIDLLHKKNWLLPPPTI